MTRFLRGQDKVKITIMFRGRETTHPERGEQLLMRLAQDVGELGTIEQRRPSLGVRDLAPAEHDRDLDLVPAGQEAADMALLGVVVVLRDLRPELDLPHVDLLLMATRGLLLLGLLVLVFGVVEDAAHRRACIGSHLDEVEVTLLRVGERVGSLHDSDLLTVLAYEANFRNANPVVDPSLIPLGRAPVELSRDRH